MRGKTVKRTGKGRRWEVRKRSVRKGTALPLCPDSSHEWPGTGSMALAAPL
eukprot:jgi/Mesvir1/14211/Mv25152-RA.1